MTKIILIACLLAAASGQAQSRMESYRLAGERVLQAGDTLYFGWGSISGQFAHIYFRVGRFQKRKAAFSMETLGVAWLPIHHFATKKVGDQPQVHAVMELPHRPKWEVWVELEAAFKKTEINIKPYIP